MKNPFILGLIATATMALALGTLTPVAAQSAPGGQGGQRGNQAFAKMLLSLNLSDGQKGQIRTMMADARTKMKTLSDPQAKRDTMRNAFAKIETVLTPPQAAKLKAEREAYFKAHPPRQQNHS